MADSNHAGEPEYTDLVPFRTFGSVTEAELLEAVLRNAGVYAAVKLEQNVLDGAEVIFNAGVPVWIKPEDRAAAESAVAAAKAAGQALAEGELPPGTES